MARLWILFGLHVEQSLWTLPPVSAEVIIVAAGGATSNLLQLARSSGGRAKGRADMRAGTVVNWGDALM